MPETNEIIDETGQRLPGGGGYVGGMRPICVSDCRSAKRLLSRVLTLLQKREVGEVEAKTISYVVGILISTIKTHELEERLNFIEKSISQRGVR